MNKHFSQVFVGVVLVVSGAGMVAGTASTPNDQVYFEASPAGVALRPAAGSDATISAQEMADSLLRSDYGAGPTTGLAMNSDSEAGAEVQTTTSGDHNPLPPASEKGTAAGNLVPAPTPSMAPAGGASMPALPTKPTDDPIPSSVARPDTDGNIFLSDLARQGNRNPFDPARILTGSADARTVEVACVIGAGKGQFARINRTSLTQGERLMEGVWVERILRSGVILRVESGNALVFCPVGMRIRLITSPS